MSQQYSDIVYRTLIASSHIEGREPLSSSEATITARVRTSGFKLLKLQLSKNKATVVEFNPEDFTLTEGDSFTLPVQRLNRYMPVMFGDDIIIESLISDNLSFKFHRQGFKKVPVVVVNSISYHDQYTSGEGIRISPDSLVVYGEDRVIDDIRAILTKPLNMKDLKRSIHGNIKLEIPSNIRVSTDYVEYSIDVARFVEIDRKVPLSLRNVPPGIDFSVLPSKVDVRFRCRFPLTSESIGNVSFYVDFKDFVNSKSGKCLVGTEGLTDDIISLKISPEVVDCFLEEWQ